MFQSWEINFNQIILTCFWIVYYDDTIKSYCLYSLNIMTWIVYYNNFNKVMNKWLLWKYCLLFNSFYFNLACLTFFFLSNYKTTLYHICSKYFIRKVFAWFIIYYTHHIVAHHDPEIKTSMQITLKHSGINVLCMQASTISFNYTSIRTTHQQHFL